jgi:hypothetical protein
VARNSERIGVSESIYVSFGAAISSSDCLVSDVRMIRE